MKIGFGGMADFSHWSPSQGGVQWRSEEATTEVDGPGSGEICFPVHPTFTGWYFFTAETSAPHGTDHNDMWIKFSGGLTLVRSHKERIVGSGYIKACQNEGGDKRTDVLTSVDFKPHSITTHTLVEGAKYRACLSGRSSQFTMFSVILIPCRGGNCVRSGKFVRGELKELKDACD